MARLCSEWKVALTTTASITRPRERKERTATAACPRARGAGGALAGDAPSAAPLPLDPRGHVEQRGGRARGAARSERSARAAPLAAEPEHAIEPTLVQRAALHVAHPRARSARGAPPRAPARSPRCGHGSCVSGSIFTPASRGSSLGPASKPGAGAPRSAPRSARR